MTAPGATAIDVAMALRSVRKLRGLTLRQASSRLGVSESNWSRIERGCVPLMVQHLLLACLAFDVSPSAVLGDAATAAVLRTATRRAACPR